MTLKETMPIQYIIHAFKLMLSLFMVPRTKIYLKTSIAMADKERKLKKREEKSTKFEYL